MKLCLLGVLFLALASVCPAQRAYTHDQVIAYAKSIDVKTLDSTLPSRRLEDWLQSGAPNAQKLIWLVEDTCWLKPDTNKDYPLCAHIRVIRNDQWGEFLIQVGTLKKGISGPPRLSDFGFLVLADEACCNEVAYTQKLSELPLILDQPNRRIVSGVRKLYDEIVAHHLNGIPTDDELVTIRPLLSKRLNGQLQTAKTCEADYLKQHPTSEGAVKPGWMNTGIFTGQGRPLPTWAFAVSGGPQQTGSLPVTVDLRYFPDPMKNPAREWEVVAEVIDEDGTFVVDDVRILDRDFTGEPLALDGPSHVLSQSFAGCDGPHWIGVAATAPTATSAAPQKPSASNAPTSTAK